MLPTACGRPAALCTGARGSVSSLNSRDAGVCQGPAKLGFRLSNTNTNGRQLHDEAQAYADTDSASSAADAPSLTDRHDSCFLQATSLKHVGGPSSPYAAAVQPLMTCLAQHEARSPHLDGGLADGHQPRPLVPLDVIL